MGVREKGGGREGEFVVIGDDFGSCVCVAGCILVLLVVNAHPREDYGMSEFFEMSILIKS